MSRIPTVSSRAWLAVVITLEGLGLAALPMGGAGCTPNTTDGGGNTPAKTYHGRITSIVTGDLSAESLSNLTATDRQKLAADGISVQESPPALISPELPLQGHWVEIGGVRYMTDENGHFTVDSLPDGAADGKIFSQLSGQLSEGTFPIAKLKLTDVPPETVVIMLGYVLPSSGAMDGQHADPIFKGLGRGKIVGNAPDGCPLRGCTPVSKPGNCCLDYDNPARDGLPRARGNPDGLLEGGDEGVLNKISQECNVKAYANFINSVCFKWTYTLPNRPCGNEGAVNPILGGPSCFDNHKNRYCQEMDINGFDFPTRLDVRFGQKVRFTVKNSTPANETFLKFKETDPGKLEIPVVAGIHAVLKVANGGFSLEHYNDAYFNHYPDVQLDYTAPDASTSQPCQRTVHLVAQAGGFTKELEIHIGPQLEMVPPGASIQEGGAVAFKVQAIYTGDAASDGSPVDLPASEFQWFSSNEGSASVSADGVVTGIAKGGAVITAQRKQCDGRATATVSVIGKDETPPPGTGAKLAGEWLGNWGYLDGTRYVFVINLQTSANGQISGTIVGKEVPIPDPIPPASELRNGSLHGNLVGSGDASGFVFTVSGDWELSLEGEDLPPDPPLQRLIAGTLKIKNNPAYPDDAPYHGFWSFGYPPP